MTRKLLPLLLLIFITNSLHSQNVPSLSITLEECKKLAHDNYPAIRQYDLIAQTRDYTLENAAKSWLPQISANINGLVVTDMLDNTPMMQQMGVDTRNWMAAGNILIKQALYDGGKISANKKIIEAQADVDKHKLDVMLYELNQRIEQLYFGILTLDAQIKLTNTLMEDLNLSNQSVASMINGGIASSSDLDMVKVSQLKAEQTLEAQQSSRNAYLQMLSTFIGKTVDADTQLQMPFINDIPNQDIINRPELTYFESQKQLLKEKGKHLNRKLNPTISLFGMGLYHTQMSDIVKNGMLSAGVTLNWNIGALYTRKNDFHKLELQSKQIESDQATFLFNNHLQKQSTKGNITTLQKQLEKDDEIIILRKRIRDMSEKRVQLGTESVNEMLRDIYAVNEAQQQQALHKIQLIKEIYCLKNNQGL